MKKRVLVAMSGGVDSSVAAYLLKKEGFEVTGATMYLGPSTDKAVKNAEKVCRKLKISHRTMDFSKDLEKKVVGSFLSEYINGRTPNPCVDCNRSLKFGILLKKARLLGFDFLGTGHYAAIRKRKGKFFLKKAKDKTKDQSYFLYSIDKKALKFILFPLAGLTKKEVYNIAGNANLPISGSRESQDICFIPKRDFRDFLSKRTKSSRCGHVLDLEGNVLGEHKGAVFYTIGQRGGLGIGYRHPLYVLSKDMKKNRLIVGKKSCLNSKGLIAGKLNILVKDLPGRLSARIRYNQKEADCEIVKKGDKIKLIFKKPQKTVTPGQSVVFYKRGTVLGGGVIEQIIK